MAKKPTEVQQEGGNLNDGQEYERKVLLFIAASLSQNKAVKAFWIVSNPTEIDKIDDVVVGVSFDDSRKDDIALFVQVKHTAPRKSLWFKLNDKDKKPTHKCYPIKLTEYKNSFEDLTEMMSSDRPKPETALQTLLNGVDVNNYFVCIVTNMENVDNKLVCEQFDEDHPIYFLNIRYSGQYQHFDYKNAKFNANFYKQLYVFIGQPNSKDMDNIIAHILGENSKQIPYLDKVIKDFMQRDLFCGVLTKEEFESKLCEVVVNYWMAKDKKVDIIIEKHIELWNKILSGEEIINLSDNKMAALLAYHYQCVIRKEVDECFDWQKDVTKLTETIKECIRQKYDKNVTDVNDLLILLWRENKIPLAIKSEYTPNILSFLQKFKTVKRKFVIFCSEHSPELKKFSSTESVITYVREITDNKTLENIFDLEVSLEGRRPVALKKISAVPIESAVKGIYKDLAISQVLAWTEKKENIQHIIGPQLHAPDEKYITRYFTQRDEEQKKLTQEAVLERVGPRLHIITGEPGMGKSNVLEALAHCFSPKTFVIYIKLRDCLKDIEDPDVLKKIERDPIHYFFNKMTNNTDDKITKSIMEAHKTSKRLCLFLDGFDEILPFHGWRISSLIEEILISTDIPIFCTTRPHAENKIIISADRTIHFKLLPFDYKQVIEYFSKTNIITEDIIVRFDLEFLGNALHLNMISQININQEDIDDLTTGKIYKRFIGLKYKETYNKIGCSHNEVYLPTLKSMKMHRVLAMADIFGKEYVISKELISDTDLAEILSEIEHIGIGYVRNSDKSFQFVHKTYGEYFVADWLLHNMVQHVSNTKYLKHFHKKIWEESAYRDIRTMIIELTRNYDLWLEIRKYFFINSDNENKSSTCNCNGYRGWLKCTMSHPKVLPPIATSLCGGFPDACSVCASDLTIMC